MQTEGTTVLAGLSSGDGPLSVRVRPSSFKRDSDRRTTSTSGNCLVNVHAKSRLTLESLRTLRPEDKGQAGACPDRTRAIPCKVLAVITTLFGGRARDSPFAEGLKRKHEPSLVAAPDSNIDSNSSSHRLTTATSDSE